MLQALLRATVDFIIPPRRSELVVRALTLSQLQRMSGEEPLPYHDPRVQALVWELKYFANKRAAELAGSYLAEHVLALAAEELAPPILVPVPMHSARRRERGHNQTELLCKAALFALRSPQSEVGPPVEYLPNILHRMRATHTQQGLERTKRLRNVKNSMRAADPELVEGRVCIVVDDVTTTGATLTECARALKAAGARRVHTVALARS